MTDTIDRTLTVLVVDDDPDTADTTAHVLRSHGFSTRVARDAERALAAVVADPPDVVLLDIGLPGMTGWELAIRLRERAAPRRPLLVAVSGRGEPADLRRSDEVGIDLHLVKPVDPAVLVGMLGRFERVLGPTSGQVPSERQTGAR